MGRQQRHTQRGYHSRFALGFKHGNVCNKSPFRAHSAHLPSPSGGSARQERPIRSSCLLARPVHNPEALEDGNLSPRG